MTNKKISINDAVDLLLSLPYADFHKIVKKYSDVHGTYFNIDMERLVTIN